MATINIKIDLGQVDFEKLETDDDIREVAKKLVPQALKQAGEAAAEATWIQLQKAFKGPGLKANNSVSDKRKFIQEAGKKYAREASSSVKKQMEDHIVEQISSRKRS